MLTAVATEVAEHSLKTLYISYGNDDNWAIYLCVCVGGGGGGGVAQGVYEN